MDGRTDGWTDGWMARHEVSVDLWQTRGVGAVGKEGPRARRNAADHVGARFVPFDDGRLIIVVACRRLAQGRVGRHGTENVFQYVAPATANVAERSVALDACDEVRAWRGGVWGFQRSGTVAATLADAIQGRAGWRRERVRGETRQIRVRRHRGCKRRRPCSS